MVCYYGRQVCKTGLSTNEPGLKMSGIGGFGGSKGSIRRYISRRVVSNLKPCGAIYRHGVITGFRTTRCVKRASKCASIAGGVGRVNAPRFKCATKVTVEKNKFEAAYDILVKYFNTLYNNKYNVILVGDKETLETDLENPISQRLRSQGGTIIHITKDTEVYIKAPLQVQEAIDLYNNLKLMGYINETLGSVKHVIGLATAEDEAALQNGIVVNGVSRRFGNKLYFNRNRTKYITMYSLASFVDWFESAAERAAEALIGLYNTQKKRFLTAIQKPINLKALANIYVDADDLSDKLMCKLVKYISSKIFGENNGISVLAKKYCENKEKEKILLKALIDIISIAFGRESKTNKLNAMKDVVKNIGLIPGAKTAFGTTELNTALNYL